MAYSDINNLDFVDLYLHGDTPLTKNFNVLYNPIEMFMQEIEIAIKMAPGEVWGIFSAIDITQYVFSQYITAAQVKQEVSSYIIENCVSASKYPWDIEVVMIENKDSNKLLHIIVTVNVVDSKGASEEFKSTFVLGS